MQYSRNYVVYQVNLAERSLVVENEIFAPGWSGICETHAENFSPHRVDGGLRGWVLDAGEHRLRVTYRTPWLAASAASSLFFLALWILLIVVWFRSEQNAAATS